MEIRRLADDLELAALRLSPKSDLETALQTNVDQLESALSRVSIGLATQFRELAERTTIDAQALRTLADGVHQELSMQAAGQVRRVSKWGKYPLLAGALPAVCLLLVAPLTEWALDQITKTPAQQQDAKPQAARGQIYEAAPDGQRFLLKREVRSSPIHVVINWEARLTTP
jgi:hypothetical protein